MAISSWRWLLVLEGLPAVVCGALTYSLLPSHPVEATFLTQDEKTWITAELAREAHEKTGGHSRSALRALAHPRIWHLVFIFLGTTIGFYGMTFYMPQAIKSLLSGYSNTKVGFVVMVPYIAGVIAMILVSRSSDRWLERRYHSAIPLVTGGLALALLGVATSPLASIILWSFAAMGICSFWGPFWSLPSEFLAGFGAASGIALINSAGNLGGFVGPSIIGSMAGGSGGLYRGLALAGGSWLVSATLVLLLPKKIRSTSGHVGDHAG